MAFYTKLSLKKKHVYISAENIEGKWKMSIFFIFI